MNRTRLLRSQYDVVVIGAGPAGCAAAITIKKAWAEASVLLLERGSYPRHKVCGEFVSPEAVELLKRLAGNVGKTEIERAPRISRSRLMVGAREIQVAVTPPAISLPRYQLDAMLWSAAASVGVECVANTLVKRVRGEDRFCVELGDQQVEARAVINASGRWSNLSATQAGVPASKWLGVKAHFVEKPAQKTVDMYFFRGGYCGVQPVDAGSVNVCAMVRADVAKNLSAVFAQHSALHKRSRSWTPLTETITTAPLVFHPPRAVEGGMMLVGDAAGFIDPFLGDGISLALHSGALAGVALVEFCAGKVTLDRALAHYHREYRRALAPAFSRAARLRRLLDLPTPLRAPLIKLAKLPGLAAFVFKQTRGTVRN